jgi:hypothetical protein
MKFLHQNRHWIISSIGIMFNVYYDHKFMIYCILKYFLLSSTVYYNLSVIAYTVYYTICYNILNQHIFKRIKSFKRVYNKK